MSSPQFGMTPRQRETFDFIRDHIERVGCAPTYSEIQEEFGLASKSNVQRIISALVERGLISNLKGRARSIVLVDKNRLEHVSTAALVDELKRREVVQQLGTVTARDTPKDGKLPQDVIDELARAMARQIGGFAVETPGLTKLSVIEKPTGKTFVALKILMVKQ